MHDIRIIALDLDGTLTNERKEITPHTLDALLQVQREVLLQQVQPRVQPQVQV